MRPSCPWQEPLFYPDLPHIRMETESLNIALKSGISSTLSKLCNFQKELAPDGGEQARVFGKARDQVSGWPGGLIVGLCLT